RLLPVAQRWGGGPSGAAGGGWWRGRRVRSITTPPPPFGGGDFLSALVAEDAHAGEGHGDPRFIRRGNDLVVADRTARLDHRRGAGGDRLEQAVGEGEEGFRGAGRALGQGVGQPRGLPRPAGADCGDE